VHRPFFEISSPADASPSPADAYSSPADESSIERPSPIEQKNFPPKSAVFEVHGGGRSRSII
jgi:hypothetical protein